MDPNKLWSDIVAMARQGDLDPDEVEELQSKISDLETWIELGGFAPDAWKALSNDDL